MRSVAGHMVIDTLALMKMSEGNKGEGWGKIHLFTACHTLESFGKEVTVLGGSPFLMIHASHSAFTAS